MLSKNLVWNGLVLLAWLGVAPGFAAGEWDARFSPEAEEAADQRREQIRSELGELGGKHEWAGAYYHGDGLGVNVSLLLSPKSGYVFEWRGCLGVYDRNYGDVAVKDGRLRLTFTFKNKQKGFQGIAREFIPVAWGQRKYLVPADDVVGFYNEVNSKAEPRDEMHGRYLLREGDEKLKVSGRPNLPSEFKAYLLAKPVEARIIEVKNTTTRPSISDWYFYDTKVTLPVGKKQRLLPGMELHVVHPAHIVQTATITEVGEHTAEAVITQMDEKESPRVGWRLSTLPRYASVLKGLCEEGTGSQPAGSGN